MHDLIVAGINLRSVHVYKIKYLLACPGLIIFDYETDLD